MIIDRDEYFMLWASYLEACVKLKILKDYYSEPRIVSNEMWVHLWCPYLLACPDFGVELKWNAVWSNCGKHTELRCTS